jgi:UDP-glucose 4-epimerase
MFANKTLLITGGTGSFGNAVLKRFWIRILLKFASSAAMRRSRMTCASATTAQAKFYIGDVRDARSVEQAMRGVDYVFHAAALKQVPSCEFHPMQAVRTNVLGTENVLEAAIQAGVKRWSA